MSDLWKPLSSIQFLYPEASFIVTDSQSPCSPALSQLGCFVFRTEGVGHWGHWMVLRFHIRAV